MKHFIAIICMAVFGSFVLCDPVLAELPHFQTFDHVGYQARITLSDGNTVADGPHSFVFTLHDHPTASSPIWTETRTESTSDGLLSVSLGQVVPLNAGLFGAPGQDTSRVLYLEVSVDGETISPIKTQLIAVPYAIVAERLLGDVETGQGSLQIREPGSGGDEGMSFEVGPDGTVPVSSKLFVGGLSFQDHGASVESDQDSSRLEVFHNSSSGGGGRIAVGATDSEGNLRVSGIGSGGDESYVESTVDDLQGLVVLCNTDGSDSTKIDQYVAPDSSGLELRMNKADLVNSITMSTSQTREHILLGRQVGVPSYNQSMEMTVDSLGSVLSQLSSDEFGNSVSRTTHTRGGEYRSEASKLLVGGPSRLASDPSLAVLDSSRILSLMDDLMVLSAIYVNQDSAVTTQASSDKRKQSLYFPESFHSAIDLLVDGTASMVILKKINPSSGMPDSNIVMNNDGDLTMSGTLEVGGNNGVLAESTSLTVPRISTSQRDALTPINGMIIYNITTNQFNFYENNAWVTK